MLNDAKLLIELIPKSSWGVNLRTSIPQKNWRLLGADCIDRAGHNCEICGAPEKKGRPLECHEVWQYDEKTVVQKLVRLIALCKDCHRVKHAGRALNNGEGYLVTRHLQKVNDWTDKQIQDHLTETREKWLRHSMLEWLVDINLVF